MSDVFHHKFHRQNHHTYNNPANPDSGHDPIASKENPFQGDFVLHGGLSAVTSLSAQAGYFDGGTHLGILVKGNPVALSSIGNVNIGGDLTVSGVIRSLSPEFAVYSNSAVLTGEIGNTSTKTLDIKLLESNAGGYLVKDPNTGYLNLNFTKLTTDWTREADSPYVLSKPTTMFPLSSDTKTDSAPVGGVITRETIFNLNYNTDHFEVRPAQQDLSLTVERIIGAGLALNARPASNYLSTLLDVNVDNTSICVNGLNELSTVYSFTSGIKIFDDDSTGPTKYVTADVDNSTIKLNENNKISSVYTHGRGLNIVNSVVGINYNTSNLGLDDNSKLQPINVLKTNLNSTDNQSVNGSVSAKSFSTVDGIAFLDGSVLTSATGIGPKVTVLPTMVNSSWNGLVGTSDNNIKMWGRVEKWLPGSSDADVWPSLIAPFLNTAPDLVTIYSNKYMANFAKLKQGVTIKKIVSGRHWRFVLFSDGTLYTCGSNVGNQLGAGPSASSNMIYSFTKVDIPGVSDFVAGNPLGDESPVGVFAAVTSGGRLYTWGTQQYGTLGIGTVRSRVVSTPTTPDPYVSGSVNFPADTDFLSGVKQVFFTSNTMVVLKTSGYLYVSGIIGANSLSSAGTPVGTLQVDNNYYTPTLKTCYQNNALTVLTGVDRIFNSGTNNMRGGIYVLKDVSTSNGKTYGTVYVAGITATGRSFGLSTNTPTPYFRPMTVGNKSNLVTDLVCNGADEFLTGYIQTSDNSLYSFGDSKYGQNGIGTTYQIIPVETDKKATKLIQANYSKSEGGWGAFIGGDGYLYVAGKYTPTGLNLETNYSWEKVHVPDVVDACIVSDGNKCTAALILDKNSRVFIASILNGHKFTGSTDSKLYFPREITNYL